MNNSNKAIRLLGVMILVVGSLVTVSCDTLNPDDYEYEGEVSVEGESKRLPNGTREDSIRLGVKVKFKPKSKKVPQPTEDELRNLLVEELEDFLQPFSYIRQVGKVSWSGSTAYVDASGSGPYSSVRHELTQIENLALDFGLRVTKEIKTIQIHTTEQ